MIGGRKGDRREKLSRERAEEPKDKIMDDLHAIKLNKLLYMVMNFGSPVWPLNLINSYKSILRKVERKGWRPTKRINPCKKRKAKIYVHISQK